MGSAPSATSTRERVAAPSGRRNGPLGGALLEFIIVLPVLLMLAVGIWEFGRIFDAWLVSTNASREGARYAMEWIPDPDDPSETLEGHVRSKVTEYVTSGFGPRLGTGDVHIANADIDVESPASGQVRVVVRANVDIWVTDMLAALQGHPNNQFTVTAWTTMRR